jgi:hypothetical protein
LPGTNEASTPTNAWRLAGFDAGSWLEGQAPFYYDDDLTPVPFTGNTLITGMRNIYSSLYFRHEFVITNAALLTNLTMWFRVDDALAVWLNGSDAGRTNLPQGELSYTNRAIASAGEPINNYSSFRLTNYTTGINVLAVMAFNNTLTSSDLLVDMYVMAEFLDPAFLAPRLSQIIPPPGQTYYLTNITVTFSKPVMNVEAGDLLVNGIPATAVAGANQTYTFELAQPAYGPVAVTWAANHGITDLGGVPFNEIQPGATWNYKLVNPNAPVIASRVPAPAAVVIRLTNATVTFNKAVSGVDATDLLINGNPASAVTGTDSNYVFSFSQPAYGTVPFSWASNPAIVDAANANNVFDVTDLNANWQVTLVFQEPPVVATFSPLPGNITNLTSITVGFTEGVTGVDASDLLINGQPATGLNVINNSNYVFSFAQPAVGPVAITWAANHGIADLGFPTLPFDETGPGARWDYNVVDGVPPTLAARVPVAGADVSSLTSIFIVFSEAVVNVDASDLLINDAPATGVTQVTPSNYTFTVAQPAFEPVQITWAANHGITDPTGNPFNGASNGWSFTLVNPNAPVIANRSPAPGASTNVLTQILVQFDKPVANVDASDLLVDGNAATSVVLSNGAYVFSFPQPPYGSVSVSWATNHGIADAAQPANVFQAYRTNASWQITLYYQAPPTIATVYPAAGSTVSSLSQIAITFSETVINVAANNLLVNDVPASNLSGGGSNYVFSFPAQPLGTVTVRWATNHGIVDIGIPPMPFDHTAPAASWNYTIAETNPPVVAVKNPPAGAVLSNLFQVEVTFSEPVMNVDASDLLLNGVSAYGIVGNGSNYIFSFNQPPYGGVNVTWAVGHGITDVNSNPFDRNGSGATWSYTLQLAQVTLVASNSTWAFVKGTAEASNPTDAWRQRTYDDSSWSNALAFFYFGDPLTGTLLSDMQGLYSSIYIRKRFTVDNPAMITNLTLRTASDDGYVAWINGVELPRFNMGAAGAPDPYNGLASGTANELPGGGPGYITYVLTNPSPASYLVSGTNNVLAIHAFNVQLISSSDFAINAELTAQIMSDPANEPPRILTVTPASGDVLYLTNITVTFTKPVTGVNASDLLINGTPATAMTGANNQYTFTFSQPAFGVVYVTWAANHGIVDLTVPPKQFDGTAASARFQYSLLNPNAPIISSRNPGANTTVGSLTEITVTFNKPVLGVDATDLLINGLSATNVSGSGATYTFGFPPPPFGSVLVSWALNHGIRDTEAPANDFDAMRPGASWQINYADLTPPIIAAVSPAPGAEVTNLTQVAVTFSEAVANVNASDLLINGIAATGMSGSGSNYTFTFAQPNTASIVFTWAALHGITDLATLPNAFDGTAAAARWQYRTMDNVAPVIATIYPPAGSTVRELSEIRVTFSEPIQGIDSGDLLVNGLPANSVNGSGAGPYIFYFAAPATGAVQIAWASGHGIGDLAIPANPFAGQSFVYTYDPNATFAGMVIINEIMYHPSSENTNEEYLELYNTLPTEVNLTGCHFNRGVSFTFTNVTIPGRDYLVVAANLTAFRAKYPAVTNVVGNWVGLLSNSGEDIELETGTHERVDLVAYADEGDWALRQRGPLDNSYRGWEWFAKHDGRALNTGTGAYEADSSLELIHPLLPNQYGQSWAASTNFDGNSLYGTPGRQNSVFNSNIAPLIVNAMHYPPVPTSTNTVNITAQIIDEAVGAMAFLNYRNHSSTAPPAFTRVQMFDDGAHNDGLEDDGVFGITLPAFADRTVIEFYIEAQDAQNNTRTWPAAARTETNTYVQAANALYQVDNNTAAPSPANANQPMYRIILTETERVEFNGINRNSDAQMNATFITSDADGTKVRHNCGVRIRGAGSRSSTPPNNRVNIPTDRLWNGMSEVN